MIVENGCQLVCSNAVRATYDEIANVPIQTLRIYPLHLIVHGSDPAVDNEPYRPGLTAIRQATSAGPGVYGPFDTVRTILRFSPRTTAVECVAVSLQPADRAPVGFAATALAQDRTIPDEPEMDERIENGALCAGLYTRGVEIVDSQIPLRALRAGLQIATERREQ